VSNYVKGITELARDDDDAGNRTREVEYIVHRDTVTDGPDQVLTTAGLPAYGDSYQDGLGHSDHYCFCTAYKKVRRHQFTKEVGHWWSVVRRFTTVPPRGRCKAEEVQSPFDTPPEISVRTVKYTTEPLLDKDDSPIMTSSHEFVRGPQNEWELGDVQIKIKCAVLDPQLPVLTQMKDTLNAYDLWGYPPRTIKLSDVEVDLRFLGNCYQYADRTLTFDARYRARRGVLDWLPRTGTGTQQVRELEPDSYYETWDRYVVDEGTKVLNGKWVTVGGTNVWQLINIGGATPDKENPQHFIRFQDRQGNVGRVILNGHGVPADTFVTHGSGTGTSDPVGAGRILIAYYGESDFSILERLPMSLFPLVMPDEV
jgi:hypothetical protein